MEYIYAGMVEGWLAKVVDGMQGTMKASIKRANRNVNEMKLDEFLFSHPAQVALLGLQFQWTADTQVRSRFPLGQTGRSLVIAGECGADEVTLVVHMALVLLLHGPACRLLSVPVTAGLRSRMTRPICTTGVTSSAAQSLQHPQHACLLAIRPAWRIQHRHCPWPLSFVTASVH